MENLPTEINQEIKKLFGEIHDHCRIAINYENPKENYESMVENIKKSLETIEDILLKNK